MLRVCVCVCVCVCGLLLLLTYSSRRHVRYPSHFQIHFGNYDRLFHWIRELYQRNKAKKQIRHMHTTTAARHGQTFVKNIYKITLNLR